MPKRTKHPKDMTTDEGMAHIFNLKVLKHLKKHVAERWAEKPKHSNQPLEPSYEWSTARCALLKGNNHKKFAPRCIRRIDQNRARKHARRKPDRPAFPSLATIAIFKSGCHEPAIFSSPNERRRCRRIPRAEFELTPCIVGESDRWRKISRGTLLGAKPLSG